MSKAIKMMPFLITNCLCQLNSTATLTYLPRELEEYATTCEHVPLLPAAKVQLSLGGRTVTRNLPATIRRQHGLRLLKPYLKQRVCWRNDTMESLSLKFSEPDIDTALSISNYVSNFSRLEKLCTPELTVTIGDVPPVKPKSVTTIYFDARLSHKNAGNLPASLPSAPKPKGSKPAQNVSTFS
jgi:hypothetical protein